MKGRQLPPSDAGLAAITFLFVIGCGLVLQFFLVPMALEGPGAKEGLAPGGDWGRFHSLAVERAHAIADQGWSAWSLRPEGQAPAGIASAFYTVLPNHPSVFLPLHGALFAIAVVMARRVLILVAVDRSSATLAVMPFLLLPSFAMVWGQLHKDIFSGTGMLLILSSLLSAFGQTRLRHIFFMAILGATLMVVVRPYLIGVVILAALPFVVAAAVQGRRPFGRIAPVPFLLLLVFVGAALIGERASFGEGQVPISDQHPTGLSEADRASITAACGPTDADVKIDRALLKICAMRV